MSNIQVRAQGDQELRQCHFMVQNVCKHMLLCKQTGEGGSAGLAEELFQETCKHALDGLSTKSVCKLWGRIVWEFCNELEGIDDHMTTLMKSIVHEAAAHISHQLQTLECEKDTLETKLVAIADQMLTAKGTIEKLTQQNNELTERIAKLETANNTSIGEVKKSK